jgi:hypothetical protein
VSRKTASRGQGKKAALLETCNRKLFTEVRELSQANNNFGQNSPELQKRDQRESPSDDPIQKPILTKQSNGTCLRLSSMAAFVISQNMMKERAIHDCPRVMT